MPGPGGRGEISSGLSGSMSTGRSGLPADEAAALESRLAETDLVTEAAFGGELGAALIGGGRMPICGMSLLMWSSRSGGVGLAGLGLHAVPSKWLGLSPCFRLGTLSCCL